MELASVLNETVGAYDRQGGPRAMFSPASPDEGLRLMRTFLRVERTELREQIFRYVEEVLRRESAAM